MGERIRCIRAHPDGKKGTLVRNEDGSITPTYPCTSLCAGLANGLAVPKSFKRLIDGETRAPADDDAASWARLDFSKVRAPEPPSVGQVRDDVYLFTRGRRHSVYGESESGKSRLCYCAAVREAKAGNAVVILNGEMADEDVLDWLVTSEEEPYDAAVLTRVFVYPSAGLLTEPQRKRVLSDLAEAGLTLTLVVADSATSVLSEAGLNPNKSEDVEALWRDLGLWFTRLPSRPAFVMIDHLSKGADGENATGSIRKHNVADTTLLVENVDRFSPTTPYGKAKSGFSKVTIKKGRRGGRGQVVARIIGHNERVWIDSTNRGVPWAKGRDYEPNKAEVNLLRAVSKVGDGAGSADILDAVGGNRNDASTLLQSLRDTEAEQSEKSFLVVKKEGRTLRHYLTERGRSYVAE